MKRLLLVCVTILGLLPILLAGSQPCVFEEVLLGSSEEEIADSWERVYRSNDTSIAIENHVYQLWQRNDEQMVAVFEHGKLCDYLIRNMTGDSLRGSVESEFKALPTWLHLSFGLKPDNPHYYDVGSGRTIDSWLTSDGKVVVWYDSSESWVHDAFSMDNAPEFVPVTSLNTLIHLPYLFR